MITFRFYYHFLVYKCFQYACDGCNWLISLHFIRFLIGCLKVHFHNAKHTSNLSFFNLKMCHTCVICVTLKSLLWKRGHVWVQSNEKLQNSGERFVKFPDSFMIAIGGWRHFWERNKICTLFYWGVMAGWRLRIKSRSLSICPWTMVSCSPTILSQLL